MSRRYVAELYANGAEDGTEFEISEDDLRAGHVVRVARQAALTLDSYHETPSLYPDTNLIQVRFEWDGTFTERGRPRFREAP